MGKTGPKPKRDDGYHVTGAGYLRHRTTSGYKLQHVEVWEAANGPVPPGMQLHHVNHNGLDNRLENLMLVDPTTHKRIHGGCELRDGVWWKPCGVCKVFKPIDAAHWYLTREGWPCYGRCRPCHIARVVADGKARKARRRAERDAKRAEMGLPLPARKAPRPASAPPVAPAAPSPVAEATPLVAVPSRPRGRQENAAQLSLFGGAK